VVRGIIHAFLAMEGVIFFPASQERILLTPVFRRLSFFPSANCRNSGMENTFNGQQESAASRFAACGCGPDAWTFMPRGGALARG
jgi:hypothetical protein